MKKTLALMLLVFSMLLSLCACEEHAVQSGETPGVPPSPIPAASEPEVSPSPETSPSFDEKEIYRSFLSENYEKLSAACFGVISGIGLIDLDMDSKLEMVLFDAGASASMGVQLFDIIDGGVECISIAVPSPADNSVFVFLIPLACAAPSNTFTDERLTRRENEIAQLVSMGNSIRSIALNCGISEGTVKKTLSNIYSKLNINSRSELIRIILLRSGPADR